MSQSPTASQLPLAPGSLVGGYRIERLLGSGGMADVYYAMDQRLDRPVALKVLRPALALDEIHLQRFEQEAKAAASLVHPNIVQIYNVGQDGDLRFIAQEYIPGINLRSYLSSGLASTSMPPVAPATLSPTAPRPNTTDAASPTADRDKQLPIQEALSILLQVLAALSKSANAGIVHRDIKPENIMLTRDGDVKVADFGLAYVQLGTDPQLTHPGTTLGTPSYMSPEQIQGQRVDIRSDLYSLGITLFHMLYGQPLYRGDTPLALAMQHVNANLPDMDALRPAVPNSLKQLLQRLLAKAPEQRFSHPTAVLDFLHEHRNGDLSRHWPERIVPMPNISLDQSAIGQEATRKLQALLRRPTGGRRLSRRATLAVAIAACLLAFAGGVAGLGLDALGLTYPTPQELLAVPDTLFEGIPRQADAKQQYLWALLDRSSSRIAKWEAVGRYFPQSASQLNKLYVGLAQLQLARVFQEAGDLDQAMARLESITSDASMLPLVQAYGWLQRATIEHSRDNKALVQAAVFQALRLRETVAKNRKDLQQLDRAVRELPSDIELYWTPEPEL